MFKKPLVKTRIIKGCELMAEVTIFDEEEGMVYIIPSKKCPFCACKKIEFYHERKDNLSDFVETIQCINCNAHFSIRYRDSSKRESVKLKLIELWNQRA